MKKGVSALLLTLLLLIGASPVTAEGETLDMEKAAIRSVNNSQSIQSIDRSIKKAQDSKGSVRAAVENMRASLQYQNNFQMAMNIYLMPLQIDSQLTQLWNTHGMITNAVRIGAYSNYISLLKAEYAMNIQLGLLNDADAVYRKAKLQEPLGLISQADLELTRISYEKARYLFDSAKSTYESALISLNNTMGEELGKQYTKLRDSNIYDPQLKTFDAYLNRALKNRGEITNAEISLELAEKTYEYGLTQFQTDRDFYIQEQVYAIEDAKNALELGKITVQQDIVNKYKSLDAAIKAMEAQKSLAEMAAFTFQAAEIRYQNSQISQQEFDKAKVTKAQADIDYKNAQLDAWLAQAAMDSACDVGIYQ